jgi:hypothetical protein
VSLTRTSNIAFDYVEDPLTNSASSGTAVWG